jgi:hypothetical protein
MKKPAPFPVQAEDNANTTTPRRSYEALSPRQARLLLAMLHRPVMRRDADRIAGATNSPDVVLHLRRMGLEIDTERLAVMNQDGNLSHVGKYHLKPESRPLALELLGVRHASE